MQKSFSILFCFLFAISLKAQFPFTDSAYFYLFGNSGVEEFRAVCNHSLDSGYVALGTTSGLSNGASDFYLVKTDWTGNTIWSRSFGTEGIENGTALLETHDHGFLLGGFTNKTLSGDYDFFVVKTDSNGFAEWTKTYGGSDWDFLRGIALAPDSGFLLCGQTFSFGNNGADVYLIRTDKNGDTLWTRTYGGSQNDCANKVLVTADSFVVMAGFTESNTSGMKDLFLLKCDLATGDTIFTRKAGGAYNDAVNSICEHRSFDFGWVMVGYSESFNSNHDKDIWLIKYDTSGNVMWQSSFGSSSGNDEATCIYPEGYDFFVSGYTPNGSGETDLVAGILNFGGFWLWNQSTSYGSFEQDLAWANTKTLRGDYLFAGSTQSFNASATDAILLLTDSIKVQFQSVHTSSNSLVGISEPVDQNLQIFPNPAFNEVYLTLPGTRQNTSYRIYSSLGQILQRGVLEHQHNIHSVDVRGLSAGTYYLECTNEFYHFRATLIICR